MKILQVLSALKKNGTETFVMNVMRNIDREKFQFDFLVFDPDKTGFYEEIISGGSKVYFLPPRRESLKKYTRELDKFFKEHAAEYEAIHLHGMSLTSIAPLRSAARYGIKKRIAHIHGASCQGIHNRIFHKFNRKRIAKAATRWLACSKEALDWGFGNTPVGKEAEVMPNGIRLESFKFDPEKRDQIRKELGIGKEKVIINVGAFNRIKNQEFLIDIFSGLQARNRDLKLLLVGKGPLLDPLKEKVKSLGLEDRVIFTGHRDDVAILLQGADLMVMPSLHEGLGIVVIEAQASGLPVITSTGIPPEAKVSDLFARIDLTEDKVVWGNKIIEFLEKSKDRTLLHPDLKNYSIENTVNLLSGIYSE